MLFVFLTVQLEGIIHQDWKHSKRACLGRDGQVRVWCDSESCHRYVECEIL